MDDCISDESVQDQEVFVWSWMGILTNVPAEQTQGNGGGAILMKQLADFNPVQITAVDGADGYTGYVIVLFTKDWTGFKNALAFHNYFESQRLGKLDWKEIKQHVEYVFGWLAKQEDYKSDDPVSRFLSANGGLKTVSELEQDMSSKTDNFIANLTQHITTQSKYLQELEWKCNQMNLSLQKVMEESDILQKRYNEGTLIKLQLWNIFPSELYGCYAHLGQSQCMFHESVMYIK